MLDVLDRLTIDWTDLDRATAVTDALLHELAADKGALRMLVDRAAEDDDLLAQCECHRLLDKIVLYDGLASIRHQERPLLGLGEFSG